LQVEQVGILDAKEDNVQGYDEYIGVNELIEQRLSVIGSPI
jgi:hypothetical protein